MSNARPTSGSRSARLPPHVESAESLQRFQGWLRPLTLFKESTMLRTYVRASLSSRRCITSRRSLHDRGTWGYQEPTAFVLPDFTPSELANRNANAPLLRLVESYRARPPFSLSVVAR